MGLLPVCSNLATDLTKDSIVRVLQLNVCKKEYMHFSRKKKFTGLKHISSHLMYLQNNSLKDLVSDLREHASTIQWFRTNGRIWSVIHLFQQIYTSSQRHPFAFYHRHRHKFQKNQMSLQPFLPVG